MSLYSLGGRRLRVSGAGECRTGEASGFSVLVALGCAIGVPGADCTGVKIALVEGEDTCLDAIG